MSVQAILKEYQFQERAGHIPAGSAMKATVGTVLEAGLLAFHKTYFGPKLWNETRSDLRTREAGLRETLRESDSDRAAEHRAEQYAGLVQEAFLSDIAPVRGALRETHTSTDLPAMLSNARATVVRDEYRTVNSDIETLTTRRTVNNFMPIKGIRTEGIDRLPIRPERTDVQRITFGYTEDFYAVANMELAFDYTWEMYLADDLSLFITPLEKMGRAAARTRVLTVLDALATLPQTTLGTVGGPNIARLDAARTLIAARTAPQNQTGGKVVQVNRGLRVSDVRFPTKWAGLATTALNSEKIGAAPGEPDGNPVYKMATPREDAMMARVLGDDWLAYDASEPFIERAVLRGYEAGPKTSTKLADVVENLDEGSFDNHSFSIKVSDNHGAKVIDADAAIRVKGV